MTDPTPAPRKEINRNPRRDSSRLSSVTTAIHLLKTFTKDDKELGISELAKRLSVAKSTVHRLAGTLLEEGLLQQNPDNGRYCLGVGLFSLGSLVRSRLDVTSESKNILNQLREQTQENVRLAVLERQSVVFLHDFESPQTLRLRSGTGQLRPAFCTAEGICLISGLREPELGEFLSCRARRAPRKPRRVKKSCAPASDAPNDRDTRSKTKIATRARVVSPPRSTTATGALLPLSALQDLACVSANAISLSSPRWLSKRHSKYPNGWAIFAVSLFMSDLRRQPSGDA